MSTPTLRPIQPEDREWIAEILADYWGSPRIVSRGRIHQADEQSGFIALLYGQRAGLFTYHPHERDCEITSLASIYPGQGVGRMLLEQAIATARAHGARRLWLITTNDNTPALRFYQCLGFSIAAVYPGAIQAARLIKPEIPQTGVDDIPIRDEIELEIWL
jgi:ribosomal protein S18 acetylase RimI-like enzyme